MILTVAQFREHVESALEDDAIQRLLDAAEAEIVRIAGAPGAVVELVRGGSRYLSVSRPVSAVTSVTETRYDTTTTLAADDYLLYPGALVLERLNTGTNPRSYWYGRVAVTYTPADDEPVRIGVQLDLVNLAINYAPGLSATTVGSWSEQYRQAAQTDEHGVILSRLREGPSLVVVGG